MRMRTDGAKVYVVAMKREPDAQGQTVSHTHCRNLGDLKPGFTLDSGCARTD